jgi:hemerythrin-like domain-containing protein
MSKRDKIITMMLKDHGKIINLLNQLEKNEEQDSEIQIEAFNQFKWELKRHFLVEETAIFTYYDPEDDEGYSMVPKLIKDHKEISEMLSSLEKILKDNEDFDTATFRKRLSTHKDYEEETFYPMLERELDSAKKKMIIDKISTQI